MAIIRAHVQSYVGTNDKDANENKKAEDAGIDYNKFDTYRKNSNKHKDYIKELNKNNNFEKAKTSADAELTDIRNNYSDQDNIDAIITYTKKQFNNDFKSKGMDIPYPEVED